MCGEGAPAKQEDQAGLKTFKFPVYIGKKGLLHPTFGCVY